MPQQYQSTESYLSALINFKHTSSSESSRYPTVSFVRSTSKGSPKGISLEDRSSGSLPRILSRMMAQSAALLQKGPSLSCLIKSDIKFQDIC